MKKALEKLADFRESIGDYRGQIEVLEKSLNETVGVPEVPGGYYTGRNLENAFRYVVNNNENPRQTLTDYILSINNEINRKRDEFGLGTVTDYKKNSKNDK